MDQCIELLCFQFASIVKRSSSPCSVGSSVSSTHTRYAAVLLTRLRAAFFFCLRSFREQDGTGSGVRAGENSWCCSLEKQLALDTWPVLHCTVRPTEEPSPGDRPRLPRPTSLHPPPPLAAVIERGFEIVFFVLFFFKPCVFPRCNLKPVVNNQNGERWEGFP